MSRRNLGLAPALCLILSVAGLTSCDWTGGSGSDFNTSRGGININVSGFYRGAGSGGRAVARSTGGAISNFTIQQSGNVLEVLDNNGQRYRGTVGSPLATATANDLGLIPTGAQLANFQINWKGKDGTAGKNVQFTGIINVVAVTDIRATTTQQSRSNNSTNTTTANNNVVNNSTGSQTTVNNNTSTTTNTQGTNGSQVVNTSPPPNPGTATETFNNSNTTTTTTGSNGNTVVNTGSNRDVNNVTTNTSNSGSGTVTESTYGLSDANTQYRMRGTWIEEGGVTANVDALSAGAGGVLVVLSTGQNASNFIQPTTLTQPTAPTLPGN
jgi:hypothetical protein